MRFCLENCIWSVSGNVDKFVNKQIGNMAMNLHSRKGFLKASQFYSLVFIGLTGLFGLSSPFDLSVVNAQGQTVQDSKAVADKLVELGKQQNRNSQYQDALKSYQSALNYYRLIKDRKGEVSSLIGLGDVYGNLRQHKKALEFCQQALTISKQIGDRIGEVKSLSGYGYAYGNLGDFQKGIAYYRQSITLARLIGERKDEAYALERLGLTFYLMGDYKATIDYCQQAGTGQLNREGVKTP